MSSEPDSNMRATRLLLCRAVAGSSEFTEDSAGLSVAATESTVLAAKGLTRQGNRATSHPAEVHPAPEFISPSCSSDSEARISLFGRKNNRSSIDSRFKSAARTPNREV